MRYITPLKAARGTGAAGPSTGTRHHWVLTVTSVALAILTPAFLLVMSRAVGLPREGVLAYFSKPYPAIVTALFLIVGMYHFVKGTRNMIDDYLSHTERKVAIIFSEIFAWAVIAAAGYALARMALTAVIV